MKYPSIRNKSIPIQRNNKTIKQELYLKGACVDGAVSLVKQNEVGNCL